MTRPDALRCAALAAAACAAGLVLAAGESRAAQAEDRGLHGSVRLSTSYDDNLFRLPGGLPPSAAGLGRPGDANLERGDALLMLDTRLNAVFAWHRQRFGLALERQQVEFRRYGAYDSDDRNVRAHWSGDLLADYSARASIERGRHAAELQDERGPSRDVVRRQAAQAAVGWQEHPDLRVDVQVDAVRQRHGRIDRSSADVDLGLLSLAASWRSGLGNQLSVRLRAGDTRYPNPVVDAAGNRIANGHRLIDAQAGIDWQPGGHSRVAARLGWGARRHDERSERNTSGLTSSLECTLAPTAAQVVSLTWRRDLAPLDDLDRLFAVSSTATLGWRWTPWAQWQFDAGTAWRSTRFRGAPQADLADATLGRPDQRDRWQQWQLAGRWLPHESLQVQGTVQQQERRSNRSGRDYRSHSIEVATQWTF